MIVEKFHTNLPEGYIRSVKARFRYPDINRSISVSSINQIPSPTNPDSTAGILVSFYDGWTYDNDKYRVFQETQGQFVEYTTPKDLVLERTIQPPVNSKDIVLYIGGRIGQPWKPIYISEIEFEYV